MTHLRALTASMLAALLILAGVQGVTLAQQRGAEAASPERLAAARDLLEATNTDAQFAAVVPGILAQLRQMLPPSSPQMEADLNSVYREIERQFIERRHEILDEIAGVYARRFTAEEMKAVADFYRTPVGQKFIAALPELMQEGMALGSAWGRRIGIEAEQKVREEMRKRGYRL